MPLNDPARVCILCGTAVGQDLLIKRGVAENTCFGLFFIREGLGITGLAIRETGKYGRGPVFEITVPGEA